MARQEFTARQKDEILQRNMKRLGFPVCEVCEAMIKRGRYHVDHIKPCWEGGTNNPANGRLICLPCHAVKSGVETKQTSEADRKGRKDRGIRKAQFRPLAGTVASGLRKKMDGTVVRRNPQPPTKRTT